MRGAFLFVLFAGLFAAGCGSPSSDLGGGPARESATSSEAGASLDGDLDGDGDGDPPASDSTAKPKVAYVARVVSRKVGGKGGFHADRLPDVVMGPPQGGGCCAGSTDVYSLGDGGEIVLGFDVEIVDGAGTDFIVFENAFEIGGDPKNVLAEPAEVSVSEDGVTWTAFPCTATAYPYGSCAGWHPVYATPSDPPDPDHPERAGGDPFDLATIGVARARFVRIRDMNAKIPSKAPTAGFDLDAIAVLRFADASAKP